MTFHARDGHIDRISLIAVFSSDGRLSPPDPELAASGWPSRRPSRGPVDWPPCPPPRAVSIDCLSIREGRLWMERCDAVELARRFGTPVYVVSEDQLRRNARRIATAFANRWPEGPVTLLPSLKANLSLALRRILNSEGLGCDTFGPGSSTPRLPPGSTRRSSR